MGGTVALLLLCGAGDGVCVRKDTRTWAGGPGWAVVICMVWKGSGCAGLIDGGCHGEHGTVRSLSTGQPALMCTLGIAEAVSQVLTGQRSFDSLTSVCQWYVGWGIGGSAACLPCAQLSSPNSPKRWIPGVKDCLDALFLLLLLPAVHSCCMDTTLALLCRSSCTALSQASMLNWVWPVLAHSSLDSWENADTKRKRHNGCSGGSK